MSKGSTTRARSGASDDTDLAQVMLANLAHSHADPDLARQQVRSRLNRSVEPSLQKLAEELKPLARDQQSTQTTLRLFRQVLDYVVGQLWDASVAAHARLEALDPLGTSVELERVPRQVDHELVKAVGRVLEESAEPLRGALLTRCLHALVGLVIELDEHELGQAAGASSDYAALLRALAHPEAIASLRQDDPLAEARLRGVTTRERLVQVAGGTLSTEQVAKHLGLTRQAVDKRRRAGRLLALSIGRRGYLYPVWQFGPDGVLPGLELVLSESTVRDPWMLAAFFLSGDPRVGGRTPLEALQKGEIEAARRAARGYGEHSAA